MKLVTKSILFAGLSALSLTAMAADPIVGTWQTYEDGQPKAQVKITQSGNTFNGTIVAGNTEKAKQYVGKTALMDLASQGGGKYKGKAKDPRWGFSVTANITVNGNNLSISTLKGSQNWKKIK